MTSREAMQGIRVEILEQRNRELRRKNNQLQAEKIEALKRTNERHARRQKAAWMCVPVVGLLVALWALTGLVEQSIYTMRENARKSKIDRDSDTYAIAAGYKT